MNDIVTHQVNMLFFENKKKEEMKRAKLSLFYIGKKEKKKSKSYMKKDSRK
jgi:hypothetical protein